ncbi:MAG TPA: hypothetical protein VFO96_11155 [Gemmatimonadales bacterium]|nr:hypothetical protein [Gemmatimonadales bacterium]
MAVPETGNYIAAVAVNVPRAGGPFPATDRPNHAICHDHIGEAGELSVHNIEDMNIFEDQVGR